jgi:hypothetical protein
MRPNSSKKRIFIIPLIILLVVVVVVAAVPQLLSTDWGKSKVLNAITPHVPGDLSVEGWSLGWFSGQRLKGLRYEDKNSGVRVTVPDVSISKGLVALLMDHWNIGTATVNQPEIYYHLPEESRPDEKKSSAPDNSTDLPAAQVKSPIEGSENETMALPPIQGRVAITEGVAYLVRPGQDPEPIAKQINMDIDATAIDGPIAYQVQMVSADQKGRIQGKGDVHLDRDRFPAPDSIRPRGDLSIENWEISKLLEIAASRGNLPTGSGLFGSQLVFEGNLDQGLQMNGNIDLAKLQLSGGPLGEDTPYLETIQVTLDAIQTREVLTLKNIKLDSPLASGNISGDLYPANDYRMAGNISVDLAATAAQIPGTLRLKEGTRITEGALVLDAGVEYKAGENNFFGQARIEGLKGVSNKKEMAWKEPFIFDARGKQGAGGLVLDQFSVKSAFMNGEGRGDLNDLNLTLDADLGAALEEVSKFISLQGYSAGGKLNLQLAAKRKDEKIVGLTGNMQIDNLAVRQQKTNIIPKHQFKADFIADCLLSPEFNFSGIGATQANYQAWLGQGTFKGAGFEMAPDGALTGINDFTLDGDAKLKNLTLLLHALGTIPRDMRLDGDSRFKINASSDQKRLNLDRVEVTTEKFSFEQAKKRIVEKKITLAGKGFVEIDAQSALLEPASLETSAGTVNFETIGIDWKDPKNPALRTRAAVDMDAGLLMASVSDFLTLAPKTRLDGRLKVSLESRPVEGGQKIELKSTVAPFRIRSAKSTLLSDKSLQLDLDAQLRNDFKQVSIGQFTLKSSPLNLEAVGDMESTGKLPRLEGRVKMSAQLESLQKLLPMLPKTLRNKITGAKNWHATGQVRADLTVTGKNEKAPGFLLKLDSKTVSLMQDKQRLIPKTPLNIEAKGGLMLDDGGAIRAAVKPDLTYDCWLGTGRFQAAQWNMADNSAQSMNFKGSADLGKLSALLRALGITDPTLNLTGAATAHLKGDFTPERLQLSEATTEIKNFYFGQKDKKYRDKHLFINTGGTIDLTSRSVDLSPLNITSSNGNFNFDRFALSNWAKMADTLKTKGGAEFDINTLVAALSDYVAMPPDTGVVGSAKLDWQADTTSKTNQQLMLNADISEFQLKTPTLAPFDKEQVSLRVDAQRNPSAGSMRVKRIAFTSSPISFDASGDARATPKGASSFSGKGNLALDLERAAAYVKALSDLDLEMAGKSETPFAIQVKTPKGKLNEWWKYANFEASLKADLIKAFGVEVRTLEVPVRLNRGTGSAILKSSVNNGQLYLKSTVDLMRDPPVLSIPEKSRVFEGVEVTQEMANDLLARIHPIFRGATLVNGTLDLDLDYLSWPVSGEGASALEFAGRMHFHNLKLDSSTLVYATLTALNVEEKGMDLGERTVEFVCKNGRIECSPLKTKLSDTHIILGGSLGLDKSLDYLAQVPVTEHIVGQDLFKYLEGTIIRVPISGTLSKPDVSVKTVQQSIADLAKQAGTKKLEDAAGKFLKKLFE